jgi:hypothetical protein
MNFFRKNLEHNTHTIPRDKALILLFSNWIDPSHSAVNKPGKKGNHRNNVVGPTAPWNSHGKSHNDTALIFIWKFHS